MNAGRRLTTIFQTLCWLANNVTFYRCFRTCGIGQRLIWRAARAAGLRACWLPVRVRLRELTCRLRCCELPETRWSFQEGSSKGTA